MNNKIPMSAIAQTMSARSGRSRKECEDLLRNFFMIIGNSLLEGETVKVKGFGTFKLSRVDARMSVDVTSGEDYEIPAHNRIVFLPAKELATAVNAPFEMFETVELNPSLTEEELMAAETDDYVPGASEDDLENNPNNVIENSLLEEPADIPDSSTDTDKTDSIADSTPSATSDNTVVSDDSDSPDSSDSCEYNLIADDPLFEESQSDTEVISSGKKKFRHGFLWGMSAAIIVVIAGCGALYWLNDDARNLMNQVIPGDSFKKSREGGIESDANSIAPGMIAEIADGVEATTGMADVVEDASVSMDQHEVIDSVAPTAVSGKPVYDTISPSTGLGTLARKHYGDFHFWPYIYKENEKILGHPDRIRPGTRVVIPPLAKYGVDPSNPRDKAKAKSLDAEIYSRYHKSGASVKGSSKNKN